MLGCKIFLFSTELSSWLSGYICLAINSVFSLSSSLEKKSKKHTNHYCYNSKFMNTAQPGKLYLVPLPIAAGTHTQVIPDYVSQVVKQLEHFLAEDIRTARRYVKALGHLQPMATLQFVCLDKYTTAQQVAKYMQPVLQGKDIGLLAEAGCPGVADPGATAVQYAHQHSIEVVPLVGPCSMLLALMASGLNGQCFAFHGYLPIDQSKRKEVIKKLENAAWKQQQTQIFIETPYRNNALLATILATCQAHTLLCIGQNITAQGGWIKTKTIQQWRAHLPELHKVPAVFLLYGEHS